MSDSKALCCFCRLPRAELSCGACSEDVCRSCTESVDDEAFSLLSERPEVLSHAQYCPRCFETIVEPALADYGERLKRARNVGYWARTYRGHIPVIKKARRDVEVAGLRDRDDALIKLGFMAVELGFNGLVHGELVSRKVRENGDGYQRTIWSGRATPCMIDQEKLDRADYNEATWRVIPHR